MRFFPLLAVCMIFVVPTIAITASHSGYEDHCDSYGDCVSSSVSNIRANPDGSLFLGDSFSVILSITAGPNSTGYSISWSYDPSIFERSGNVFTVVGNESGTYPIAGSVSFAGPDSTLTTARSVTVIHPVISLYTKLVNVTDSAFCSGTPTGVSTATAPSATRGTPPSHSRPRGPTSGSM